MTGAGLAQVLGQTQGLNWATWVSGAAFAHLLGIWQVVKGLAARVVSVVRGLRLRIISSSIMVQV
ncbi:MAG TPA: hypothetical protein DCM05_11020 [Elusimicrobia bacterium]|nr:hypothetical protein [Elusimicrobiota bacterium]